MLPYVLWDGRLHVCVLCAAGLAYMLYTNDCTEGEDVLISQPVTLRRPPAQVLKQLRRADVFPMLFPGYTDVLPIGNLTDETRWTVGQNFTASFHWPFVGKSVTTITLAQIEAERSLLFQTDANSRLSYNFSVRPYAGQQGLTSLNVQISTDCRSCLFRWFIRPVLRFTFWTETRSRLLALRFAFD